MNLFYRLWVNNRSEIIGKFGDNKRSVNGTENIIFVQPMAKCYKYRSNNANEKPLADERALRQINRIITFMFVDFYCTKTDCKAFLCAIDSWRECYTYVNKCLIKVWKRKTALSQINWLTNRTFIQWIDSNYIQNWRNIKIVPYCVLWTWANQKQAILFCFAGRFCFVFFKQVNDKILPICLAQHTLT